MNLRSIFGRFQPPRKPGKDPAGRLLVSPQQQFLAVLKTDFSPRLRAVGFSGSGRDFRRVLGDVIHAINIQRNPRGGSCILNLGVHVSYLPCRNGRQVDPSQYQVIDCEFQGRIVDPMTRDWWRYGDSPRAAESSARSLIAEYFASAEPKFNHYRTVASFLSAMEGKALESAPPPPVLGVVDLGPLPIRAAAAAAHLHHHAGNFAEARRFAQTGLGRIRDDVGIALKPELEALAAAPARA